MGLLKIGLIIVFKIQILRQWNIATREKVCFDKGMRTPSKKSPQIYLSMSEADTKVKVIRHTYLHNKQFHKPRFFINNLMTYKQ